MKWTVERWLLIATFVCSSAAFVFGVGVQWAKTADVEADVEAMKGEFVRRDVYASDQRQLTDAVRRLTATLDKFVDGRVLREDRYAR